MSINSLPNFLIVGVAKAGTTTLVKHLSNNKEILISKYKEPRYLTYEFLEDFGYKGPGDFRPKNIAVKTLKEYKNLFSNSNQENIKAKGEASVDTIFYYKQTIPKIKNEIGEPKIIILLRNPVDRAVSAYSHLIREERENLSFEDALAQEKNRLSEGYECIWGYSKASMYYEPVKAFYDAFKDVKIILFEDFILNPDKTISDVFNFLKVNNCEIKDNQAFNISGRPKNKIINRFLIRKNPIKIFLKKILGEKNSLRIKNRVQKINLKKIQIDKKTKQNLFKEFESDIKKLEVFLNIDLSIWRKYNNES